MRKLLSMKRSLMEILACPLCKGDLELEVEEEEGDEVVGGVLLCRIVTSVTPSRTAFPT